PAPPGPPGPRLPNPPARAVPAPPQFAFTVTDVRIQALSGLLEQDPDRAVPALREIVVQEQETPSARRALFVLGLSPHEQARATVMQFAQTGPEALRVVAISQMARWTTPQARTALTTAYAVGTERVKLEVLRSLSESGGTGYIYEIATSEADPGLRESAIFGLGNAGGRAELWRLYTRASTSRASRVAIIDALTASRGDRQLVLIARTEKDSELRGAAVAKLRVLDTAAARAYLALIR
ncbi:MAG: hypothetical protein M3R55_14140, partial [Acidobacteriota bacterium]|nr:hypothetical protein [Acidobacteriota bacterium]